MAMLIMLFTFGNEKNICYMQAIRMISFKMNRRLSQP